MLTPAAADYGLRMLRNGLTKEAICHRLNLDEVGWAELQRRATGDPAKAEASPITAADHAIVQRIIAAVDSLNAFGAHIGEVVRHIALILDESEIRTEVQAALESRKPTESVADCIARALSEKYLILPKEPPPPEKDMEVRPAD